MGPAEWLILLVLSAVWGGSFFFVEVAVQELPPLTVVFSRVCLGAASLWVIALLVGARVPASPQLWAGFFVMGLLNNAVPFMLLSWGQTQIASGLAAILNATTPLFTALVASALFADERLTVAKAIGVLFGFIGTVVMIGPAALAGLGGAIGGQLAALGAAFTYACAAAYGRRFAKLGVRPAVAAAGQVTASALLMAPLMLAIDRPWTMAAPSLPVLAALAGLALLSTGFAYVLYFQILAKAGATNLSLVTFLVPVSAIVLGATFLGERLQPEQMLGMAFIGLGLACIDGRLLRLRPRAS